MADALAQQTLASTVVATLDEVRAKDGDGVACLLAVNNIRASTRFLLDAIGRRATRMTILATAASLDDAIKSANANSEYLH